MLLCTHYPMEPLAWLDLIRTCAVGAVGAGWSVFTPRFFPTWRKGCLGVNTPQRGGCTVLDLVDLALCRRKILPPSRITCSTRRCCLPLARMRSRRFASVAPDGTRQVLKLVNWHLKEVEHLNRNRHDVGPITGISAPVKRHAVSSSLPDIDVRCRTHSHASAKLYPRPSADARSRYLGPSLRS